MRPPSLLSCSGHPSWRGDAHDVRSARGERRSGGRLRARIRLAAGIAGRFDAALIGPTAAPLPPVPLFEKSKARLDELVARELERVQAVLAAAERRFRAALQPEIAKWAEWRSFEEAPADALAREARSVDLLVVGADGAADAGDVVLRAGRPVLVAPAGVGFLEAREVVVGWKDAPPARRAAADALPLLRRVEGVLVRDLLDRDGEGGDAASAGAESAVRWLARHGVAARAEARPLREGGRGPTRRRRTGLRRGPDRGGGYGRARLANGLSAASRATCSPAALSAAC